MVPVYWHCAGMLFNFIIPRDNKVTWHGVTRKCTTMHWESVVCVWRIRKIENISKIQNVRIFFKTIHKLTFILDTGFMNHDDLTDKIYQKYASAGTEVCVSL